MKKENKKIIAIIDKYIKENWGNPSKEIIYGTCKDKYWDVKGGIILNHFRWYRGDLIKLIIDDIEQVGWVDQSHQYASLGINDFMSKISLDEIKIIFK